LIGLIKVVEILYIILHFVTLLLTARLKNLIIYMLSRSDSTILFTKYLMTDLNLTHWLVCQINDVV